MDEVEESKDEDGAEKPAAAKAGKHTKSEINEKLMQKQFVRENSPVRDIPYNILEESISMIERTALKLLPIMKELGNRLAGTHGKKGLQAFHTAANQDEEAETKAIGETPLDKGKLKKSVIKKLQKKDGGVYSDEEEGHEDIKDTDIEVKATPDESDKFENQKESVNKSKQLEDQVDMRTVLGFLNQNEWILNLNIGNIMQI